MNLLTLRNLTGVDPGMQPILAQVPGRDKINNYDIGDGRNTGGYRFNQRNNELLDNLTGKVDYNITTRHAVSGYLLAQSRQLRPAGRIRTITDWCLRSLIPRMPTWWRSPGAGRRRATLTNEVRGGFNSDLRILPELAGNVPSIMVLPTAHLGR